MDDLIRAIRNTLNYEEVEAYVNWGRPLYIVLKPHPWSYGMMLKDEIFEVVMGIDRYVRDEKSARCLVQTTNRETRSYRKFKKRRTHVPVSFAVHGIIKKVYNPNNHLFIHMKYNMKDVPDILYLPKQCEIFDRSQF